MRWYEAAGVGVIMGGLYGLVLWASMDALSLFSFFYFGDQYFIPFRFTAAVILPAFLCLFTVPLWVPVIERLIQVGGEIIVEIREDREDDK